MNHSDIGKKNQSDQIDSKRQMICIRNDIKLPTRFFFTKIFRGKYMVTLPPRHEVKLLRLRNESKLGRKIRLIGNLTGIV